MTRTIVTGASGFIGSAIVRALAAEGHDVHPVGTGSTSDPLTAESIASLGTFDLLVHCAGGSSVGASVAAPLDDFAKTVPPFAMLLEHVRTRSNGARVVLLSSAAVYGDAAELPIAETATLAPISPYGVHKRLCEELCASYGRTFGVASIVLRLFSVYGPGLRKQLLWDAAQKANRGDLAFAGTGQETRDWLHIDDAASLVIAAASHASRDVPILNGATGVSVTVREIVERLFDALGSAAPTFSGTRRSGDPQHYRADITRARSLGWAPKVDVARGVSDYAAWFRGLA
ncbi:MAG: NAD-dependent epimerase/dehydratase family protein [Kofleriaceae bacterium]